ncbi:MFS transporter [Streptomyces mirabilis]|uniref:MFS transporter n=1 Tax=Streptomyces mirabilis TaxID=68239 RepID=UPI0036EF0384
MMMAESGIQASDSTNRLRGPGAAPIAALVGAFMVNLGGLMVLPFIPFLLHHRLGMKIGTVGFLVAAALLVQFAGGLPGAALIDRIGLKQSMVLALGIRAVGFLFLLATLDWSWFAAPALLLISAGSALYLPANRAYLVLGAGQHRRALALSMSNSLLNVSALISPVIAAPFIGSHPEALFGSVAAVFTGLALAHLILPDSSRECRQEESSAITNRLTVFPWRTFLGIVPLVNILAYYFYMFQQNYLGIFVATHHSPKVYSLILISATSVVIIVQPLAANRIRALSFSTATLFSFLAFTIGFLVMSMGGLRAVVLGTVIVALGESVIFLRVDLEVLALFPGRPAMAFGIQRLGAGIGAAASSAVGGQIYARVSASGDDKIFWMQVSVQCLVGAAAFAILMRRSSKAARINGGCS